MTGMDAVTGRPLSGAAHLAQSVADILSTPVGTRVGRRDYGSDLPALIDAPLNRLTRIRVFAAVAAAITRWEPRLRLTSVAMTAGADGVAQLSLTGERTDTPLAATPYAQTLPLRFSYD